MKKVLQKEVNRMAFRKKKTEYTPQELFGEVDLEEEKRKKALAAGPWWKRAGIVISTASMVAKIGALASAGLTLIMAVAYIASALIVSDSSFTVKAGDDIFEKSLSLSETIGFANPSTQLSAVAVDGMNNITYAWFESEGILDKLDNMDGSHNGELKEGHYIAYSFYIKNSGNKVLDYQAKLKILYATQGIDAAVRVMVYQNGNPTIYAKAQENGMPEQYPANTVSFLSDELVLDRTRANLNPDQYDKYTVVIWLEGEDKECNNRVRGGTMKFEMVFDVPDANT